MYYISDHNHNLMSRKIMFDVQVMCNAYFGLKSIVLKCHSLLPLCSVVSLNVTFVSLFSVE